MGDADSSRGTYVRKDGERSEGVGVGDGSDEATNQESPATTRMWKRHGRDCPLEVLGGAQLCEDTLVSGW